MTVATEATTPDGQLRERIVDRKANALAAYRQAKDDLISALQDGYTLTDEQVKRVKAAETYWVLWLNVGDDDDLKALEAEATRQLEMVLMGSFESRSSSSLCNAMRNVELDTTKTWVTGVRRMVKDS